MSKASRTGRGSRSSGPSVADERAAAQAAAAQRKEAEARRLAEHFRDGVPGRPLIVASWVAAGAVTLTGLAGMVLGGSAEIVALVVSLILFLAGLVAAMVGFAVAANRSRRDQLDVGRLALLTGVAPPQVRRQLFGALGVQVVGGLVPAIMTQGLELDFGTLVPMVGVGLIFWWGAAYGDFPPLSEAR